ncbi:uncharacterized protein LOC133792349 [Humulus lupulus]|uniref:uncharacterized protein LOC133792349 n=1 Tax=Humulus lupulus TaxID=3486 RepID=UPI002B41558E|nr:uncharacterized protein LOC133792349 [Humulus lupulus]
MARPRIRTSARPPSSIVEDIAPPPPSSGGIPPTSSVNHTPLILIGSVDTRVHHNPQTNPNLDINDHSAHENPYFLGSVDHPGIILTSPLLTEKKFQSWRRDFKISIGAKNKFAFINGSLPQPPAFDPHFNAWQRCNQMVMSWVLHSVSPEIKTSIMYLESEAAMWSELNHCFDQGNGPKIFKLRESLIILHQGSDTVSTYFTKLKAI